MGGMLASAHEFRTFHPGSMSTCKTRWSGSSRDQAMARPAPPVAKTTPFPPGLESCTILERHADHHLRKLDFGAAVRRSGRTLQSKSHWVRFDILPGSINNTPGGSSWATIAIEERLNRMPSSLAFAYATTSPGGPTARKSAPISTDIKSAYHQSDVYWLQIIRTWLAGGPAAMGRNRKRGVAE